MAGGLRLLRGYSVRGLRVCTASRSSLPPPLLTSDLRHHLSHLLEEYHGLQDKLSTSARDHLLHQQIASLEPMVKLIGRLEVKEQELTGLQELLDAYEEEGEMKALAREEQETCHRESQQIQRSIIQALVPKDVADDHSAMLEVRAGAGGKEASLFTAEIFLMYQKFSAFKQWKFEIFEEDITDGGGLKHASASLSGTGVFGVMKHESGVHRVQRVPVTGAGRVHTSTMSVAILPQPSEIDVQVNPNDLRIETHRSSGPGGQSVNTTDSAVRLTHTPTGIVVRIQDDRSQHKNRSKALKILGAKLYELKRKEAELAQRKDRKEQVGSGERHERIRTYHYMQDRVTDHRLGVTVHGVTGFMEGQDELANLTQQLQAQDKARAISKLLTIPTTHT